MRPPYSTIADMNAGDHLCCLYGSEQEHGAVLSPFLRKGLEQREKIIYIVDDDHSPDTILDYLRKDGVDVGPSLASGQLRVLPVGEAYLRGGSFDPDRMLAFWQAGTEQALAEGYTALRAGGETNWALRGAPGSERLMEYESRLNDFFPGSRSLTICLYDRRHYNSAALLKVLNTHPVAVVGTELFDNFYYIPPADFLVPDLPGATLRHQIENLVSRKRVERALRESEERNRLIIETASDAFVGMDASGRITDWNVQAENTFGWPAPEVLGRRLHELIIDPEHREAHNRAVAEFLATERCRLARSPLKFMAVHKLGHRFPVEVTVWPVRAAGQISFHAFARDITERERAERELKELNETLERRVAERSAAAEQRARELACYAAELEQFAYVSSHDLQEPLRMVSSYVQLLADRYAGKLDADADRFIGYAVEGAQRMRALIQDLLDYLRAGRPDTEMQPFDCQQALRAALASLHKTIQETGARVMTAGLPTVCGDSAQLAQVFHNLIDNAMKFRGDAPPCVSVSTRRAGDEWVFSVEDNGIDIEAQYTDRIFQMFQRLHPRGKYPGSGIGLTIAKKIVERHGGRLWCESSAGRGSTFFFTLPASIRGVEETTP